MEQAVFHVGVGDGDKQRQNGQDRWGDSLVHSFFFFFHNNKKKMKQRKKRVRKLKAETH